MNASLESADTGQAQHFDDEAIDLRHYWRVLMRFKFGILGLGLIAAVLTAIVVMGKENIYQSTASLLIEAKQAQLTSIEQIYGIDTQQQEYYATQHELLKSRHLAERVINELNLLQHPEFVPEPSTDVGLMTKFRNLVSELYSLIDFREPGENSVSQDSDRILLAAVVRNFSNRLTVTPIRNTQLVNITFEANDPRLAAEVANSLANGYIEDNLEQRLSASQTASVWLTERLGVLRETLEASEERLQEFLEQEQLVTMGDVTSLNVQELDELTSQSIEVRRRSAEAEAAYRQVQQLTEPTTDELMTIPMILNHPTVQGLRGELNSVNRDIAELSKRYGRNHPRMIALASQQAAIEANLTRQVQQVLVSIENEYRTAQDNERSTLARLDESKARLQGINRNNFTLQELEREVETNRQLYDLFFTRVRETGETDGFQTTNAVVVDQAVPAVFPSKPRRSLIVMIAALAGLGFGLALAFLRDMLDNTIKIPADVEERLNANVLGLVPLAGGKKANKDNPLAFLGFTDSKHSSFAESIRTVRTGITLSSLDKPHKLIEVTSSITNEGKSTVAINLAVAAGQIGKTLLIDADLRRPSIAKSVGLEANLAGLSNLVVDGIESKDSCIHQWEEGGISVLPAGHFVPDPLELISSKKFRELLTQLRDHYDTIILDTPPINAVSDSLIMGSVADAVAYVVKADSTSISSIKSGLSRLRASNANLIGVILNQVDTKKQSYYGEGDYYGGYYDSYGYSGKPESAASA